MGDVLRQVALAGLTARPDTAPRYDALDALRGVCALCVCLFHFKVNGLVAEIGFIRGSWLFVDFFFVLSGFVIAANYRDRLAAGLPVGDFMLLRLGRVYPLHIVMLALFVAVELVGVALVSKGYMQRRPFDAHHSFLAIVTNATLTQSFGIHDRLTWNHPSWSIATEVWTYLLFALTARFAGAHLDRWLAAAAVLAAAWLAGVAGSINVTYDWGLVRCIYGFAAGALLCRWAPVPADPGSRSAAATGRELAAAAAVIAFVTFARASPLNLAAPLVFAAAVLVFARQGGGLSRLLVTPPLLTLGLLSYSIYMVHVFVQSHFDDVLRLIGHRCGVPLTLAVESNGIDTTLVGATPLQGMLLTPVMLGLVIATAYVTWRLIERPGQNWARRRAARRFAAPRRLQLS